MVVLYWIESGRQFLDGFAFLDHFAFGIDRITVKSRIRTRDLVITDRRHNRALGQLRHTEPALFDGALTWLDHAAPEAVVAFVRDAGEARILVVINVRGEAVNTSLQLPDGETYEPLLSAGAALAGGTAALAPFGYVVAKRQQR